MFEFAAFLFLAAVFPGTLLYASIYALSRSFAVFLLSSSIGKLMDRLDRLVTIRHSISEATYIASALLIESGYPAVSELTAA